MNYISIIILETVTGRREIGDSERRALLRGLAVNRIMEIGAGEME